MPNDRKRVLFIAYVFPPVGGVGAHRPVKFVKYLPEHGWDCSVLTVANPSVPIIDEALVKEIPVETIVRRARSFEPGYAMKSSIAVGRETDARGPLQQARRLAGGLARNAGNLVLQPDAQILWRPKALREGLRLLQEVRHDAIIATGPPFSSLLLGAALARRTALPLVLDYRDEWSISNAYWENKQQGRLSNWLQARMQANALRAAAVVLATTPSTAGELRLLAKAAGSRATVTHIYNGFDPLDYPAVEPAVPRVDYGNGTDRFRLSFIGTLWNLNPIAPVADAILELARQEPALLERLELVVAGRRTGPQDAVLDRLQATAVKLVRLPFVSHSEAIRLMCDSDALLLINADLPNTQRIVNAKTFEYMAARRPIFVVAPRGDLWDVVRDLPGTVLCEPRDRVRIAQCLATELKRQPRDASRGQANWDLSRFERKHLAGELGGILNEMTNAHQGTAQ
jgi:glycosyltransferase involved in cell wall biosynthesis